MKHYILAVALAICLGGCDSTVQTTSGKEYLAQYKNVPTTPAHKGKDGNEIKSLDQQIRDVAAVEPVLKFPARIGLARVDGGRLSNIPAEEIEAWQKSRDKLGAQFGEFVPVNTLVANMVSDGVGQSDVIAKIRLGAARQHLDAVLIYEVYSKDSSSENVLEIANLSIIGGYLLPSKQQDAQGFANGLLIDVVQGYPYGNIEAVVEKETRLSSSWGWGSDYKDKQNFSDKVKTQAAKKLSEQAYDMFMKLRTELAEKRQKR